MNEEAKVQTFFFFPEINVAVIFPETGLQYSLWRRVAERKKGKKKGRRTGFSVMTVIVLANKSTRSTNKPKFECDASPQLVDFNQEVIKGVN